MKMKNNMEKERIEEMKKQLFYQYLQVAGFHKEAEDWVRQALTEAHQAGIDEAVEMVMPFLKAYKQSLDSDWEVNPVQPTSLVYHSPEAVLRNQANAIEAKRKMAKDLDDTIKALQDNK